MRYSNRKEIEMKNANQINVNKINNINIKETIYMKKKEFIKTNIENKQNSFLEKRDNNISNYYLLDIINKKSKINKNIIEIKSKQINDTLETKKNRLIAKSNNKNINNNNENISNNIIQNNINMNIKNEIQKINNKNKEEKEEKKENKIEKETKLDNKIEKNFIKEKENNKQIIEKEMLITENENDKKKGLNKKVEKNYSRIYIRLSSSISNEKKDQRRLKNKDNIKLLYTYANKFNDNIKKERINTSISNEKNNSKKNNHSLYICGSFDEEKRNKKHMYSIETSHKLNKSVQKHNYSFRSINLSHSKAKKLKLDISEKNIKNHLNNEFSTTNLNIKKSINFGLNRDKKNSYNKNLEKILSKARNHKTISVQKLKKKIKMKIEEKEKINEEVEKEKERDDSNEKINNNFDKKNNSTNKNSNKIGINKSPTQKKKNYFDINIKIEKEQAKEIKIYENGK